MDAEEVFLSCSNLTVGQYRAVTLARGLTGAAGCIVSLGVLVVIAHSCYQETGVGEFAPEGLLGNCPLHLALFLYDDSSSELLTPSFPGISMV